MKRLMAAGAVLSAIALAGCAGGAGTSSFLSDRPPPGAADLTMVGRWMLAAPNAPACGLNFTAKPGATEGAVAPEGGCPERFFTARRWTLQQNALTISDDEKNMLGQFTFAGDGFEGKSNIGKPLSLTR
ncbi:MAG: AprI/Inh family metalloprotease inhibitor [Pseudolabrys sp.]|nr:AprI/Inh family metalloprotease inhibitor [Pseudolabrys sp.]MDP2297779.1 AprI/Inh family metalloprotease inhibitor [Pseudolabrys sp.]